MSSRSLGLLAGFFVLTGEQISHAQVIVQGERKGIQFQRLLHLADGALMLAHGSEITAGIKEVSVGTVGIQSDGSLKLLSRPGKIEIIVRIHKAESGMRLRQIGIQLQRLEGRCFCLWKTILRGQRR